MQALDKKSVLFLRPYKGNGSKAWDVLRKRFKSFERPKLQKTKVEELKRDLVNFDSERQVIEKEHDFNSENRLCFKCHKRGHVSKQYREN